MVRVVPTAVPVLLLCCWCQLGCTKAVGPVGRSSVIVTVLDSDVHLPRRRRNTAECEDEFVGENATTIKGERQTVSVTSVEGCKKYCLRRTLVERTCTAVVYRYDSGYCAYAVGYKTATVTGNASSTTTYFKLAYRCPRYYLNCSTAPCLNGATCKPAAPGGVGVECVCAGGWKSWFCEEKYRYTGAEEIGNEDNGTSNTATSAAIVGVAGVVGLAAAIFTLVKATGTTASSTAGTAAMGGGFDVVDVASKLGGTAIIKGGNTALAKSSDSDEEPDEELVEEPDDDAASSIYSLTDSFTNWITGGEND